MSYGLLAKNNSSETLIDSTYIHFSLYAYGTNLSLNSRTLVSFPATNAMPLILMRPGSNYYQGFESVMTSGGYYDGMYVSTEISQQEYVDVSVYTSPYTPKNIDYGLKVFNKSGDTVFSSNDFYFKIYDVQTFNLPTPATSTATVVHTVENPFYIISPIAYWMTEAPGVSRYYRVGMKKKSSTKVELKWYQYAQLGGSIGNYEGYNPDYYKILICGG